jgi:hypothetical protein
VVGSFVKGWREPARVVVGSPPDDGDAFVVYGHRWLAEEIIPPALAIGRPFWHIDNGFWMPARGTEKGYYRVSYRGIAPVLLRDPDRRRVVAKQPTFRAWRTDGRHVLFAHPGLYHGRCVGLDMAQWIAQTRLRLKASTDRPIIEREKECIRPLHVDLHQCWALVTHSSNVAIHALAAGIPVFVEPGSAAAPVGNLSLDDLENPQMPCLDAWWSSLQCQQFTLAEMRDGTAYRLLSLVRNHVDA